MTALHKAILGLAGLGLVALLLWAAWLRVQVADAATTRAQDRAAQAENNLQQAQANLTTLREQLVNQRQAQTELLNTQQQLHAAHAASLQRIEDLQRENAELRHWADQPLPAAARRLRERPAIVGAARYRAWLPSRNALPTARQPPAN